MTDQSAIIHWQQNKTPVSARFDDPYYSRDDGLAECRHVYLCGNHLPARFSPGFHIAELGFGTGLNMLAAWLAWQKSGTAGDLHYTGFEAFPISRADMKTALSAFPELNAAARPLLAAWSGAGGRITLPGLHAEIIIGDARVHLPRWTGAADAWFLDGFSPARNPELWGAALMSQVARRTAPGGTFATYTAAGQVRRALTDAGFALKRQPGYGRKRHMTTGQLKGRQ